MQNEQSNFFIVWCDGEISIHPTANGLYLGESFVIIGEVSAWRVSMDNETTFSNFVPVEKGDIVAPFLMLDNRLKIASVRYYKGNIEKFY